MLFITNKNINEPLLNQLDSSRTITFSAANNQTGQSIFFCQRNGKNSYTEIGSTELLNALKASKAEQILIYIHGFNNHPETDIFPRAEKLQKFFDAQQENLVQVLPIIWPCNDRIGVLRDYYDDQDAADISIFAYTRLLEKFFNWQEQNIQNGIPSCLKRINVLAHSMGNRVLRGSLERWGEYHRNGAVPLIFRNTFLVAADIANESLERGDKGDYLCQASRNVVVYFASDDLALRSSKVANDGNVINKAISRRLGHSGPENPDKLPTNVFTVDCDEINNRYDHPVGHSYFLDDGKGKPGLVFKHIFNAIQTGRVDVDNPLKREKIIQPVSRKSRKADANE